MTSLSSFFKGADSHLGVFYPTHYIIASFRSFTVTEEAVRALRRAGLGEDDVLAIPGAGVLRFFEEFRANSGLWAGVMTMLSRSFGTEQVFVDSDIERAHAGAGFLAIHCPIHADKTRVQALLHPFAPMAMHLYEPGGVECLV
jgi:hypothetical protein